MLTIADVRAVTATNWEQELVSSIPFGRGPPLVVALAPDVTIPKTIFKYQLQQAIYEATGNGGVRWWCKKVEYPVGKVRQAKFDISIRFDCPHYRPPSSFVKRPKTDDRRSKHISCVKCPAFVRFKGCRATDDSSVAVVVTAKFKQVCNEPLKTLRKEFDRLDQCIYAEILGSKQFMFVFGNSCQAQDAVASVNARDHPLFHCDLRAHEQERYIFKVFTCDFKHLRHLRPSLPSQRGMFVSYEMTQEAANWLLEARHLLLLSTT